MPNTYFYISPLKNFYLSYDSFSEIEGLHIIRLYEYIVDDREIGIGHAVTYGWYGVNRVTGKVIERDVY